VQRLKGDRRYAAREMGAWYWIGVAAGLGAAVGLLAAGLVGRAAIVVGAVLGLAIGFAVDAWQPGGWADVVAGLLGGALAAFGGSVIVRGALRRGGTRGGTATLVAGAAIVAAALAFVPVIGYLEALVLPLFALRLRRRQPERYAGLRTLAK
jgi:hypothetical protein